METTKCEKCWTLIDSEDVEKHEAWHTNLDHRFAGAMSGGSARVPFQGGPGR